MEALPSGDGLPGLGKQMDLDRGPLHWGLSPEGGSLGGRVP